MSVPVPAPASEPVLAQVLVAAPPLARALAPMPAPASVSPGFGGGTGAGEGETVMRLVQPEYEDDDNREVRKGTRHSSQKTGQKISTLRLTFRAP